MCIIINLNFLLFCFLNFLYLIFLHKLFKMLIHCCIHLVFIIIIIIIELNLFNTDYVDRNLKKKKKN